MVYGDDVLAARRRPAARPPSEVPAVVGLHVEHRGSGFVGVVEGVEAGAVVLRDDSGRARAFPLQPAAFRLVASREVVTLVRPRPAGQVRPRTTPSGAIAGPRRPARVARASRILVEGVHDAELLERVWGDELRGEGIVVEPIEGVDRLVEEVRARRPGPQARLGVLLDHLVPGSKEARVAAAVRSEHVLVTGHVFVDVWQGVRPAVLGLQAWPVVPRGQDWKTGICAALGEPDPTALWRSILARVRSYRDLEPSLVGAVEQLLDFLLPA